MRHWEALPAQGCLGPAAPAALAHLPPLRPSQCLGAAAALGAPVRGVELDSLISQVKDLLPDLGEGFILACLEHYGYDPEQAINNILEERLAPALRQLDRGLDRWGAPRRPRQGPALAPPAPLCLPSCPRTQLALPGAGFPDHGS